LNEGPRRRVPEEGKGPGGAENRLKLRGLFSQERSSLGPKSRRGVALMMELNHSSAGFRTPSPSTREDPWQLENIFGPYAGSWALLLERHLRLDPLTEGQ
jgi:hypothetical protein